MIRMSPAEVTAYSMGFAPRVVNAASVKPYRATSKRAREFEHRVDLINRAIQGGRLQHTISWSQFIPFARELCWTMPKRLIKALDNLTDTVAPAGNQASEEILRLNARISQLERQLADPHPRRQQSALKVILAAAVKKYDHRPGAARSPAPRAMAEDTGDGRGRVSDDTIRDLLREAEELVEVGITNSA